MVKALIPRFDGDDYQARWFWLTACDLFDEKTKVLKVIYEMDHVKAFDDVAVFFTEGMVDEELNPLSAEFYQVKFHTKLSGEFTWKELINPEFINASSVSILQRLRNAQQQYAPQGVGCKFSLYIPWKISPNDALNKMIKNHKVDWGVLGAGGEKSTMGKVRKEFRDHLQIQSDEELKLILKPFRVYQGLPLDMLDKALHDKLRFNGLTTREAGSLIKTYDDLIRNLLGAGKNSFTKDELIEILKREKLFLGREILETDAYKIGIRSFMRAAEFMEHQTDKLLPLEKYFNGRHIQTANSWRIELPRIISEFLLQNINDSSKRYHIYLSAHTSIAFAAGYYLDSKTGMDVVPVQRSPFGEEIWRPVAGEEFPKLDLSLEERSPSGLASDDVAVCINLTHRTNNDVNTFINENLPHVKRIFSFSMPTGEGNSSVKGGTHAKLMAQQVASTLKNERTNAEKQGMLHLFIAGPNGFTFFLGQHARSFGKTTLYEYDFDTSQPGSYSQSFTFPTEGGHK